MFAFSQWCHSAHRVFSAFHPRLRLGQVQEVMASALGHKTYASFKSQDLPRLDEAAYAFVSVQAMLRRAADLGITLDARLCADAVRDLHIRPPADELTRDVVTDGLMDWLIRQALKDTSHPSGHELAREIGATFDGLTLLTAEPLGSLERAGDEWQWHVRCTAHATKGETFYDLLVHGEARLPRIGRHLFSGCVLVNLHREGRWEEYDPSHEITDYAFIPKSDS